MYLFIYSVVVNETKINVMKLYEPYIHQKKKKMCINSVIVVKIRWYFLFFNLITYYLNQYYPCGKNKSNTKRLNISIL